MSSLLAIPSLVLVFEYNEFVALDLSHGTCYHLGSLDGWTTYEGVLTIANEQYPIQLNHLTCRYAQTVNLYGLFWSDPVLLATCLNDCVDNVTSESRLQIVASRIAGCQT